MLRLPDVPRVLTMLLAVVASWILFTSTASACTCGIDCESRLYVGQLLPENSRGVGLWLGNILDVDEIDDPTPADVTLVDAATRQDVAVTIEALPSPGYLIVPATPWSEGDSFTLSLHKQDCQEATAAFSIGPAVSSSAEVQMEVEAAETGELWIEDTSGGCNIDVNTVYQDVRLSLPSALEPYRAALLVTTRVDGQTWRPATDLCSVVPEGISWIGSARDRVYSECPHMDWSTGVAPGVHEVELQASLPGTDLTWTASAMVELQCPGDVSDGDAGGADAGDGVGSDAGDDVGSDEGCATTGAGAPTSLLLVGLIMVVWMGRRRRLS